MISYLVSFESKGGAAAAASKIDASAYESEIYVHSIEDAEGLEAAKSSRRWAEDVAGARDRIRAVLDRGGSAILLRVGYGGGTTARAAMEAAGASRFDALRDHDWYFSDIFDWQMISRFNSVRALPTGWMLTSFIPLITSTDKRSDGSIRKSAPVLGADPVLKGNTFFTGFLPLVIRETKD